MGFEKGIYPDRNNNYLPPASELDSARRADLSSCARALRRCRPTERAALFARLVSTGSLLIGLPTRLDRFQVVSGAELSS